MKELEQQDMSKFRRWLSGLDIIDLMTMEGGVILIFLVLWMRETLAPDFTEVAVIECATDLAPIAIVFLGFVLTLQLYSLLCKSPTDQD